MKKLIFYIIVVKFQSLYKTNIHYRYFNIKKMNLGHIIFFFNLFFIINNLLLITYENYIHKIFNILFIILINKNIRNFIHNIFVVITDLVIINVQTILWFGLFSLIYYSVINTSYD
jgi:hypothetical protein